MAVITSWLDNVNDNISSVFGWWQWPFVYKRYVGEPNSTVRNRLGNYSREQRNQLRRLGQSDDIVVFHRSRHCSHWLLALRSIIWAYALCRTGFCRHDEVWNAEAI